MSNKQIIYTNHAPQAIGTYSQAVKIGQMVYISGQIPMKPQTSELENVNFELLVHRCFTNLKAIAIAAGGTLADAVKLSIYLTNLDNFDTVNKVMALYFSDPYPARAVVEVSALPKGAPIEIEAILALG